MPGFITRKTVSSVIEDVIGAKLMLLTLYMSNPLPDEMIAIVRVA